MGFELFVRACLEFGAFVEGVLWFYLAVAVGGELGIDFNDKFFLSEGNAIAIVVDVDSDDVGRAKQDACFVAKICGSKRSFWAVVHDDGFWAKLPDV